jgi:hypothetical protein
MVGDIEAYYWGVLLITINSRDSKGSSHLPDDA